MAELEDHATGDVNELIRRASGHKDTAVRVLALARLAHKSLRDNAAAYEAVRVCSADADPLVQDSAVNCLAANWKAHPATLPWLKHLVEAHGVCAAARALGRSVRGDATAPDTVTWLLGIGRSHPSARVRIECIQEAVAVLLWRPPPSPEEHRRLQRALLSRSKLPNLPPPPDVPDHILADHQAWLEQRARVDSDAEVRLCALRCLRLLLRSGQLHSTLRACSLDRSSAVRGAALESLVGLKSHPETLPWLKALVEHDHDDVAMDALHRLLREWGSEPTLWPWVLTQVAQNTRASVRQAGLRVLLGAAWRDVPGAVEIIERCAREDGDVRVRELARVLKEDLTANGLTYFRLEPLLDDCATVQVTAWWFQSGDLVSADEGIVEVTTDHASVTIGAPCDGRLVHRLWEVAEEVPVGSVLFVIAPEPRP